MTEKDQQNRLYQLLDMGERVVQEYFKSPTSKGKAQIQEAITHAVNSLYGSISQKGTDDMVKCVELCYYILWDHLLLKHVTREKESQRHAP